MDRLFNLRVTKATISIKESELLALLKRDPVLWATCLKRGKGINRATQTRERIEAKKTKEGRSNDQAITIKTCNPER